MAMRDDHGIETANDLLGRKRQRNGRVRDLVPRLLDRRSCAHVVEHRIDEDPLARDLDDHGRAANESDAHDGVLADRQRVRPERLTGICAASGYTPRSDGERHRRKACCRRRRRLDNRPRWGSHPRLRRCLPGDQRGRGRARHGRARGQGRGARRHRLQVGRRHPRCRADHPPVGEPGRRGRGRRGDRRARPHERGRRRAPHPLEEARPLRARVEAHRGRSGVRRAGQRQGHRGRQGRADPRPRGTRVPARVARRHPARAGPRRVPRQGASLQGHRAQPLAQQRRPLPSRRPRGRAQGDAPGDPRSPEPGRRHRGPDLQHRRLRRVRRPRRDGRPHPHLRALAGATSTTRPRCSTSARRSA